MNFEEFFFSEKKCWKKNIICFFLFLISYFLFFKMFANLFFKSWFTKSFYYLTIFAGDDRFLVFSSLLLLCISSHSIRFMGFKFGGSLETKVLFVLLNWASGCMSCWYEIWFWLSVFGVFSFLRDSNFFNPSSTVRPGSDGWIVGTAPGFKKTRVRQPNFFMRTPTESSVVKCNEQMADETQGVQFWRPNRTKLIHLARSMGSLGNRWRLVPVLDDWVVAQKRTTQCWGIFF